MDVLDVVDLVDDADGVDEVVDVVNLVDVRVRPNYQPIENPMEVLSDVEFKRRFRFHKATIQDFILPRIIDGLSSHDGRGRPIAPVIKLLTCLRFFATASFQTVCDDLIGISQSSVCRIVKNVSTLLAQLRETFIKFPVAAEELVEMKTKFKRLGAVGGREGLPDIIGALDGCHIPIQRPHESEGVDPESFRNRKHFFSINVQGVVGPDLQFLDIVARWPGQEHDSRIFANSRVKLRFENRELDGRLVEDSGYPSLRYLLTPLLNPVTPAQRRYNACHISTRNPVERTFGVWKRRFPCLRRTLANELQTCVAIIVVCAVLHNIAVLRLDEFDIDEENEDVVVFPDDPQPDVPGEGLAVRAELINRLFA